MLLIAGFLQRPGGMHASSNRIRCPARCVLAQLPMTTAFLRCEASASFSCFIGAVEIGRGGIELGGAGIHHLINGPDVPFVPQLRAPAPAAGRPACQSLVGEAEPFCLPAATRASDVWPRSRFSILTMFCILSMNQRSILRALGNCFRRDASPQCRHDCPEPQVGRLKRIRIDVCVQLPLAVFPEQ